MREIRPHGSEGGEAGQPAFPTPIPAKRERGKRTFCPFSRLREKVPAGRMRGSVRSHSGPLSFMGVPGSPQGS